MRNSLPVVNLAEVKYECIYGRGCDGICCQNGRPGVTPEESDRIDANLDKFLPLLRPAARQMVEKEGYVSRRLRTRGPMLRVIDGWCIFFSEGCVLHRVGAAEGDKFRYKPAPCSLFPLELDDQNRWYVRQHGYKREQWDLFCLDPKVSPVPASESLNEELKLAKRLTAEGYTGG